MKKKIDYNNCMQRKCEQCNRYNECFGYKKKEKKVGGGRWQMSKT